MCRGSWQRRQCCMSFTTRKAGMELRSGHGASPARNALQMLRSMLPAWSRGVAVPLRRPRTTLLLCLQIRDADTNHRCCAVLWKMSAWLRF